LPTAAIASVLGEVDDSTASDEGRREEQGNRPLLHTRSLVDSEPGSNHLDEVGLPFSPRRSWAKDMRMRSFLPSPASWLLTLSLAACAGEETSATAGAAPGGGGAGGEAGATTTGGAPSGGGPGTGGSDGGTGGIPATGGAPAGGGGSTSTGVDPDDYPPETEPNGSLATANTLAAGTLGFQGSIGVAGDFDVYAIDAALGASLAARVSDGNGGCPSGASFTVQVYDTANLEIASMSGGCPNLNGNTDPDLASLDAAGTYFVRVSAAAPVPFYVIDLSASAPQCGDGIVQQGEECDDDNLVDGDGCEADCTVTPVCGDGSIQVGEECDDGDTMAGDGCDGSCQLEADLCAEGATPNDTFATATSLMGCDGGFGGIDPIGDQDFFGFAVTVAGSSVRARTADLVGTACPSQFDSQIFLVGPTGVDLGSDDDDGPDACSIINPATDAFARNLPAGNYAVRVQEFFNDELQPSYALFVEVLPPGCGDGVLQMGEVCDDANLVDGDGCSSTCTLFECGPGETLVELTASGLPVAIPDNSPASAATSTITVPTTGTVKKLAVTLSITHTFAGDLDISLDAPGAAPIVLSDDNGSSSDNYTSTVFSSDATTPITTGLAPFTGVFAPEGSTSTVLNTAANGAWVLSVADDAGGDTGSITGYALRLCVQP
jgi:cysteine-rich repeat protein